MFPFGAIMCYSASQRSPIRTTYQGSVMAEKLVKRRSAFTLVELLVVIGIIALLISMLLPALSRARETARVITCAANEHQIMLMFAMYAANQKGWLPPYCNGANGRFNFATGAYKGNFDPTTGKDDFWRSWDQ